MADARIARVSCKQNELNVSIQHSSASLFKRKRKAGKARSKERQLREKKIEKRIGEREGKEQICIPVTRPILRIYVALFRRLFCIKTKLTNMSSRAGTYSILFYTLLSSSCPKNERHGEEKEDKQE